MKGKDVTINKGAIFEVFTDQVHTLKPPAVSAASREPTAQPLKEQRKDSAALAITSEPSGAEIELDEAFVGNTPTTLQVAAGLHKVTLKKGALTWSREVQIYAGSSISLSATLDKPPEKPPEPQQDRQP